MLFLLAAAGALTIVKLRTRGQLQRALNMHLFLIRIPKQQKETSEDKKKQEKELIAVSEQMFASFATLNATGWNKLIYGKPYIALEMSVHHVGEQTHFYVAAPTNSVELIEKQIHSFYPDAEVARIQDYNIFNPQGFHAGGYMSFKQHHILPMKTFQQLEADPIGGILTAMSKLEVEGEGVAMQILIRPNQRSKLKDLATKATREMQSGYDFSRALYRAKHPPKNPEKDDTVDPSKRNLFNPAYAKLPKVVTPADEEVIKAIGSKANKQTFDVNVRLVASAPTQAMADQIFEELKGSFTQFSSPNFNTPLINRVKGRALNKLLYNFAFRLFDNSRSVYLSTEEIASLYHMPIPGTAAPRVNFLSSRSAEPPAELPLEGVHIGNTSYRGQSIPVRLAEKDRRRHLYIIGQTGTGKSSFMKQMIEQDLKEGKGLCVIEPHGDFAEHALSVIPPERANDVIYFNPADIERPIGFNPLEFDPNRPEQKTLLINELLATIDKLYNLKETGGPIFDKYFKNACLLLMDDYQYDPTNEKKKPILADISRVMVDDAWRRDKLSREKDPLVKQFWEMEAEKAGGDAALANMAPYISTKIDTFVSNDFLRVIINQRNSTIDFEDIINNGKILIVSLSKGRIGELSGNLLGMTIVAKLLAAALSRVDIPEEQRKDFYLYIDEFQNVTTDSIATILSEARKYPP